ncbi:hypothetical protein NDU88_001432 [Pleurodeles waltl]|uniref:Uncharacterized protein n=1 Tax=Pleurodeles waltl TaxID=8319 RepID=A0AAV7UVB5_PLEWA|nr:hypothetical protein NDU88_001432 [Pleurodeles waltl]
MYDLGPRISNCPKVLSSTAQLAVRPQLLPRASARSVSGSRLCPPGAPPGLPVGSRSSARLQALFLARGDRGGRGPCRGLRSVLQAGRAGGGVSQLPGSHPRPRTPGRHRSPGVFLPVEGTRQHFGGRDPPPGRPRSLRVSRCHFNLQRSPPAGPSSQSQPRRVHPTAAAIFTSLSWDRPDRRTKAGRRLSASLPQLTPRWAPGTPGTLK